MLPHFLHSGDQCWSDRWQLSEDLPACSEWTGLDLCRASCGRCDIWNALPSGAVSKSFHHQTHGYNTCTLVKEKQKCLTLFLVYKHSILFVHHSCNISIRIICMWAIDNRLCRKKPKMLNLLLLQNLHSDSYSVSILLQKENLWIGSPKWFCKSIVDYQTLYICIDLSHPIYFSDTNFIT